MREDRMEVQTLLCGTAAKEKMKGRRARKVTQSFPEGYRDYLKKNICFASYMTFQ